MLEPIIRFATWLAVASAAAAAAEPDGATRWPGFRGDGSSISTARDLPLRWGEGDGVAWTATLPGFGQSSPVVWDGTVFVTSGEGDMKQTLVVNAIGLRDGKTRWTRRFDAEQRVERTDMVSQSAPTPAVDADRVYAFFESGDLIALDHEGRTLWHRRLGEAYGAFTGPHGLGSSVALTSDAVVVLIDDVGPDYLLAVDKVTGATRWKVDRASGGSWTTPLVSRYGDREEIVVSSAGIVEAFDAADGTRLWHVDGVEKNTVASPTAAADLVVIPSSDRKWNIAIGRDGAGDVGATHVRWRTDARPPSFGSPLVHGGSVYYVSRAGIVTCVSLADGSTRWDTRIGNSCWASPIGAGERVYFFGKDGETTVLRADAAAPVVEAVSTLPVDSPVYGVAAVDGALLLRTGTTLTCVGTMAGGAKPLKVFLLAGQSNMEGKGAVSTLPWLGEDAEHGRLLGTIRAEDGSWLVRDDVWIDFLGRRGPLTVGYGSPGGPHAPLIGPELGFGTAVGNRLDEPVLLVKAAWGGKDVANDFRAPGSGGPGPFYTKTLEHLRAVRGELGTRFPELADREWQLAGFVWFQGWNDMVDDEKRAAYTDNLAQMIRDIRRDLDAPDLPVVIGELGVGGDEAGGSMVAFRSAQRAVAALPDLAGVRFVRTSPYYDRLAHELYEQDVWKGPEKERFYRIASDRPYHYLGSGKTYFLMGWAFGEAMLEMIDAQP